ncbi:hypothetical protein [Selenomonas ruminantium]|uniref:Uncharacterized protein n=1 Tax=Selenomonas ruminantium TaxID=971 RepID=A0A1I0Y9F8_SELRU|nr:hypothetical protein [Selenomonas ruminantium]SFB09842.1 hypothetical protein SAMN05216587_1112 [Selenomonas ruminantium]
MTNLNLLDEIIKDLESCKDMLSRLGEYNDYITDATPFLMSEPLMYIADELDEANNTETAAYTIRGVAEHLSLYTIPNCDRLPKSVARFLSKRLESARNELMNAA